MNAEGWLHQSIFLFLLMGIFSIAGLPAVSGQTETADISCFHCHSRVVEDFQKSVHFGKNISCTDCHGGEIKLAGTSVSIDVMHVNFTGIPPKADITGFCSRCHVTETRTYEESIHWQKLEEGRIEAPSCIDCHVVEGTHDILSSKDPMSPTYAENIPETCANCHENQTRMQAMYYGIRTDRFDTYKKSYHYKAFAAGGKVIAICSDCHENHDTKTESDPSSAIYPDNLPATCGKPDCHPGKNPPIYGGKVHEDDSVFLLGIDAKKLVTYFYIIMILFELTFTLGLIFLGISSNYEIRRRKGH
jgi:hypothetical protein